MPKMWFGSRGKIQEQQWEDASLEMSQHGSDDRVAARPRSLSAPNLGGTGARISVKGDVLCSPGRLCPVGTMGRRSSTKSIASLASIDECSEADTIENIIISEAAPPASATGADDDPFARADLLAQMSAPRAPEVAHRPRFRTWTPGHCNKKVVWERVIGDNSETLAVLPPLRSGSDRVIGDNSETLAVLPPLKSSRDKTRVSDGIAC
jgi:hypothetical protein